MKCFFTSIARVAASTFAVLVVVAVGLGRLYEGMTELREPGRPQFHAVNGHQFPVGDWDLRLLEVETGKLIRAPLPHGDHLERAAVSPWRDGLGRTHVVGLWHAHRVGQMAPGEGLRRYALPGWDVLDDIETDFVPSGSPCWFPDTSSRILFAGTNGRLYTFDFGDRKRRAPRPLEWRVARLSERSEIVDVAWSSDPRLENTLIATILVLEPADGISRDRRRSSHPQLWWLRLSRDRRSIEAAGPLLVNATTGAAPRMIDDRLPAIARCPGVGLVVAFLVRDDESNAHHLRLAPLAIERGGVPRVEAATVVDVPGRTVLSSPVFSPDGRWIQTIAREDPAAERARRLDVTELLAESPGSIGPERIAFSLETGE